MMEEKGETNNPSSQLGSNNKAEVIQGNAMSQAHTAIN